MTCIAVALLVGAYAHSEPTPRPVPTEDAALPLDDGCAAGDANGACSLSLRQLRANSQSGSLSQKPATNSSSCFLLAPVGTAAPFTDAELATIRKYFLSNINVGGTGAVVAAPDHDTGPGGDYYYHWQRDAALAMRALLTTTTNLSELHEPMKAYIQWIKSALRQKRVHANSDIRVEPKFEVKPSADAYKGIWCRPQTDAPGLVALVLSEYSLRLLKEGPAARAFVEQHLWANSTVIDKHVISYDLDWVVNHYKTEGCDLWEEVWSNDFFWGRYTMRAGLEAGMKLALEMGHTDAYERYNAIKNEIQSSLLPGHWNGEYMEECRSKPCRDRKKDSAVVEAFNVGDLNDGFLAPLSKEVLSTVISLNDIFCKEYEINVEDTKAGIPGMLYGRYPGDRYDGGNPWVLLTASLARLIYRQASNAVEVGDALTPETSKLLQEAYGIPVGTKGKDLGEVLLRAGDGIFVRLNTHLQGTNLHMAEQIGRKSGRPLSAEDLTWNYANILLAIHARGDYIGRGVRTGAA